MKNNFILMTYFISLATCTPTLCAAAVAKNSVSILDHSDYTQLEAKISSTLCGQEKGSFLTRMANLSSLEPTSKELEDPQFREEFATAQIETCITDFIKVIRDPKRHTQVAFIDTVKGGLCPSCGLIESGGNTPQTHAIGFTGGDLNKQMANLCSIVTNKHSFLEKIQAIRSAASKDSVFLPADKIRLRRFLTVFDRIQQTGNPEVDEKNAVLLFFVMIDGWRCKLLQGNAQQAMKTALTKK